jgi:hypothetical protein
VVYCLQADLAFSSVTRRDQVLSDIQAQVSSQQTWGEVTLVVMTWPPPGSQPAVSLDVRFSAQPAQQAITNRIEQFATGPRTPLAGSWYALHPCPHDEGQASPCVIETRRVW